MFSLFQKHSIFENFMISHALYVKGCLNMCFQSGLQPSMAAFYMILFCTARLLQSKRIVTRALAEATDFFITCDVYSRTLTNNAGIS